MEQQLNKRIRIALISCYPIVESRGGAERVFCNMANHFQSLGYEITAMCCEKRQGRPAYELHESVEFINAYQPPSFLFRKPIQRLTTWAFTKSKRKELRLRAKTRWLANCLKNCMQRLKPADIYIAFQPETAYVLKCVLKVPAPVVVMIHTNPRVYLSSHGLAVYGEVFAQAEMVQVLLPEAANTIREVVSSEKIAVIPNVVPQLSASPDYRTHRVVCISRLDSIKRPMLLLEAFALLKDTYSDWNCEWWGGVSKGNEKLLKKLEMQIKTHGLRERFVFKGQTDNVVDKLLNASVFVIPSAIEGFSLAMAEAMAIGLPVIGCRDCSAVSCIIRPGENGYLSEPCPEDLATVLSQLIENVELREKLGKQAKEDMKAYSADAVWGMWDDLIQRVIRENRSK